MFSITDIFSIINTLKLFVTNNLFWFSLYSDYPIQRIHISKKIMFNCNIKKDIMPNIRPEYRPALAGLFGGVLSTLLLHPLGINYVTCILIK